MKLQPLAIPSLCRVYINQFLELDPIKLNKNSREWLYFTKDILHVENVEGNITINLGWYPDMDPNGEFYLRVLKNNNWDNPILSIKTRDKNMILEKIEESIDIY